MTRSGEDPTNMDLTSIGFQNSLDELEDTTFNAIPSHIDYPLRNTIKHGDRLIDPQQKRLLIEEGNSEYSLEELENTVNKAMLAIDYIEVTDVYVSLMTYQRQFED